MNTRALNYITFVALMVTTAMGFQFLWGLLFLYWTIPNFYSGHAFLLSDVTRDDDPILFWAVQIAWVVLGALLVLLDAFPLWMSTFSELHRLVPFERELFDLVIVGSCKPAYMLDPYLNLFRVNPRDGSLLNTDGVFDIEALNPTWISHVSFMPCSSTHLDVTSVAR